MSEKIQYKQVKINFKVEHFAKLEELSQAQGISKSDWIRQKIGLNYDEARQPVPKQPQAKATDPQVLYQLNKIGGNLNQIATYANVQKTLDRAILRHLISIEDMLKALL